MTVFCHVTQRKARKDYYCDLCGSEISAGCEYMSRKRQRAGIFWYERVHIHCDAAINAYCAMSGSEDEYALWEVRAWYKKHACAGCKDECNTDPLNCPKAAGEMLPISVLGIAIDSMNEMRK